MDENSPPSDKNSTEENPSFYGDEWPEFPPGEEREVRGEEFRRALSAFPYLSVGLILVFFYLLYQVTQTAGIGFMDFVWPNQETIRAIVKWGAMRPFLVDNGEYWRLFAAIFLHHGLVHFACNSYGLYVLGKFAEGVYGKRNFALIFLLTGLSGSVASWLFQKPIVVSAGASGALFGIIGVMFVFAVKYRREIPAPVSKSLYINLTGIVIIWLAIGYAVPNIDNYGHLGGLVGGLVVGLFLAPRGLGIRESTFQTTFAYASIIGIAVFLWPGPDPKKSPSEQPGPDGRPRPAKKDYSFINADLKTYRCPWFKIKYYKTQEIEEYPQDGQFEVVFNKGVIAYGRVREKGRLEGGLNGAVNNHFDSRARKYKGQEFYKIPRRDYAIPYQPSEGPTEKLMAKSFGYGFINRYGKPSVTQVIFLYTEELFFHFEFKYLEKDELGREIIKRIQKSLVIVKTEGVPREDSIKNPKGESK